MVTKQNQTEKKSRFGERKQEKNIKKRKKLRELEKIFPAKNSVCRYLWLMAPLRFIYAGLLNKQ